VPRIELSTQVAAPVERCFDLSRDVDIHLSSMEYHRERVISGVESGPMQLGDTVTWEAQHLSWRWRMTSKITEYDRPRRFVDQQQKGPFARFHHEHRFEPSEDGTRMVDVVEYEAPLGALGEVVTRLVLDRYLRRVLGARNQHIKQVAESA
jgi:ligand-binding SRPBCC domain-containing protein